MRKSTKVWLWAALILCIATTILNAFSGRLTSAVISVVSIAGLCMLLFKEKKNGFILMCAGSVLSFVVAVVSSTSAGLSLLASAGMSLVGAGLVPAITALFLIGQWKLLK